MRSASVVLFAFLLCLRHFNCDSRDTITADNVLSKGETRVSALEIFKLGFFTTRSDDGESNKYVGIWYKVSPETVVWVANTDKPIPSSTELLVIAIDGDGNLKVLNSTRNSYFSTELNGSSLNLKHTAKLLDSGNLVLIDALSGNRLWQSFDNPNDTFLPGMRMDNGLKLTAWTITQKDPSPGNYTFRLNQAGNSEYTIRQRTVIHWKGSASTSANPFSFSELPSLVAYMLSNFIKESLPPRWSNRFSLPYFYNYTRLLMNSSGEIQLFQWYDNSGWFLLWSEPQGPCGVFNTCGKFGVCNSKKMSRCKCLPGFDPASPDEWITGNFVDGCSRKSDSTCNQKSEFGTFLNIYPMKFKEPDLPYSEAKSEDDCRRECRDSCQCVAYSYGEEHKEAQRGSSSSKTIYRCSIWTNDLKNLQENYTGGFNLSVRVDISDIEVTRRNCKPCGPIVVPYPLSSQPHCENVCDTKKPATQGVWLNQSLPFHQINWCYNGKLQNISSGPRVSNEMQIKWDLPLEPTCIASTDCEDWPNSICNNTGRGHKRCLCNQYYKWDGSILNCTKDHAAFGAWSDKKGSIAETQNYFRQSNYWNYNHVLYWLSNLS